MEKITEILFAQVFSEDGEYLGRVFDLRCQGEPEHGSSAGKRVISELLYSRRSLLEVLGFRETVVHSVPWKSVKTFDHKKLIIEQ